MQHTGNQSRTFRQHATWTIASLQHGLTMPEKTEVHMTAIADLIAGELGREAATQPQSPAHALNHQASQNQAIGGFHS